MNTSSQKPRVCIALPAIQYTPHSPYVRSTLPMVPYLAKDFEITLVYRKILNTHVGDHIDHNYLTVIDPNGMSAKEKQNKHPYYNPSDYITLWKYKEALNQFAREHAQDFDLVIEKEWPLLGVLASAFSRYSVPTVILIEAMYKYRQFVPQNLLKQVASIGFEQVRPYLRKRWSAKANSIVVETEEMKSVLLDYGYFPPKKSIYPIPYGVDPEIFAPRERDACRERLGISKDAFVLTYVGSLNRFIQEPGPIIEALGREKPRNVVLYLVGDGSKRQELEDLAKEWEAPVVFPGRLPQKEAALYIGASNLCIAPYNKHLYLGDKFTCASLKVPEYLSCARPVLTIPCERMATLLDGQRYGFLVENQVDPYREFFKNLPSKDELYAMESVIQSDLENGILKDKKILLRWWDIAEMYKQVIEETLAAKRSCRVPVVPNLNVEFV